MVSLFAPSNLYKMRIFRESDFSSFRSNESVNAPHAYIYMKIVAIRM